jgi:tRNA dimethylallyltransferase
VKALLDKHGSAVVVGGSGLYAKNLLFAMDDLPPADEKLRMTLEKQWQADPQPLINQLKAKDPAYAATADLKNSRRVLRALEVIKLTGKTYSSQRTQAIAQPAFQAHIHQIAIWPGMPELEAVIAHRTNSMMQKGLREEAMSLKTHQLLVPLQTVGYREFYQNPTGDDKALEEKITLRTRQYAKRQLTWLKKQDVHRIPIRSSVNDLFKLAAS